MQKWKIIGIVAVVVLVVVLSFAVSNKGNGSSKDTSLSNDAETIITNAQRESEQVTAEEMKEPVQIDVYDYLEFKAGSEPKIILLARPTCGYCQIAEPIIYNVAYEYDLEINYLNTDDMMENDEELTLFVQSDERFSNFGTPYLMVVQDGNIIDAVDGLTDRSHYVDFFKQQGFIN